MRTSDGRHDGAPAFTVLTLNAWFYSDPWWYDPPRGAVPGSAAARMHPAPSWPRRREIIVALLQRERPDIVGLQETGRDARWDPDGPNQAEQIARRTGYHVVYQPSQSGSSPRTPLWEYGLSVLSRHPLVDADFLRLPSNPGRPRDVRRICQAAVIRLPWGELALLNAHFSLDAEARAASARMVREYADRVGGRRRRVIVGDLNAVPRGKTVRLLTGGGSGPYRDAWRCVHGSRTGFTFPSHAPARTFDYVLVGGGLAVRDARLVGGEPDGLGFYASDHLGVLATLLVAEEAADMV